MSFYYNSEQFLTQSPNASNVLPIENIEKENNPKNKTTSNLNQKVGRVEHKIQAEITLAKSPIESELKIEETFFL